MEPQAPKAKEYWLLLLLATLWGGSYPLVKISLESIPPVTLIALRVTAAAAMLSAVAWYRGQRFSRDPRTWWALLVQALFNSIGAWTLLAWGQQYVASGLAGVLNSTSPIFVFFITLLWTRHEDVSWARLAGAMLGVLGVVFIVGVDVLSGFGQHTMAQLAILGGAALAGLAAIYGKRFHDEPAVTTAAGTMLWAAVFLCPLALAVEKPWLTEVSIRSGAAAGALALFSTAGALLIYFRLVRTLGSMGVASQSYLRCAVAVGIGVLLLGEPLTMNLAVGVGVIVASMVMINHRARY